MTRILGFPQIFWLIVLIKYLLLITCISSERNLAKDNMFKRLFDNKPIIILLDDVSVQKLEPEVRRSLETVENQGSLVFKYDTWWKFLKPPVKPNLVAAKTINYLWTIICLIEEQRTKKRADIYLSDVFSIGHARLDRFIIVGSDKHVRIFRKSAQVEQFKNLLIIPIDKKYIFQGQHSNHPELGSSIISVVTDLESVHWINSKTEILDGHHFRISGTKFPPYLDWVYDDNGRQELMAQNFRVFHEATKYFNFTYEFNPVQDWKPTGRLYPNGSWDGVYGDLLSGRADIASVSTQTVERNGLADFVGPFGRTRLIFFTSTPEKHLGKYATIHSFTMDIWICILASFACFAGLLYKSMQLSAKSGGILKSNETFLQKSVFLVWRVALEQSEQKPPNGARLLMIMLMSFILIIGTRFKSNFSAVISIPNVEKKPKTFTELDQETNYKIYFDMSGISAWLYFEDSDNHVLKNLHAKAKPVENATQCVMRTFMEKDSACIGWEFTLQVAAAQNLTIPQLQNSLTMSTESVWTTWYTFALPLNSIFTDAFQYIGASFYNAGLTRFWRNRLLDSYRKDGIHWASDHLNHKLYKKLERLRQISKSETKPLKLENFEFIFTILLVGLLSSFVRFCFELWTINGRSFLRKYVPGFSEKESKRYRRITFTESRVVPIDFVQ